MIQRGLAFKYDGTYDVCANRTKGSIPGSLKTVDYSPAEFRASDFYKELEQNERDGQWPTDCSGCAYAEEHGLHSARLGAISQEQRAGRPVNYLHVVASNVCDSDCVMCGPQWSTKIIARLAKHPYPEPIYPGGPMKGIGSVWNDPRKIEHLLQAASAADRINIVGGEPFIDPKLWLFLDSIKRKDLALTMVSNGNTFPSDDQLSIIDGFAKFELCISIDGTDKTYEWIRQGLSWETLLKNIVKFRKAELITATHCVVQAHNLLDMASYQKLFNKFNMRTSYYAVKTPPLLAPKNAPLWVLEKAIVDLEAVENNSELLKIFSLAKAEHDPSSAEKLQHYTNYLNNHRTHKFDYAQWTVV